MMSLSNTAEGFKSTEVGVIPEDWDVVALHEVCSFGGGTTPPRSQHQRYFVGGTHNWIKTTDLNNSCVDISEEQITDLALSERGLKKHPIGTVLVAMYGGFNQIGRTGCITKPSAINQALVAVKPKPYKLNSYYLLSELNYNVEYWKGVASSSRKDPNITSSDVKNYKIALPSFNEQSAIADALLDIDSLITELEKLIAKKQAIKTASMQQLLTGKKRLPEFALHTEGEKKGQPKGMKLSELGEIPVGWDVVEFGNCIRTVIDNRGKTPPLTVDGLPMLEVNAVFKQGKSPNLAKVTKYVSQSTYDNWFRGGHPKQGDILVVTVGSAGETSYVDKEGYCIAQNLISLRLNQNVDSAFVYYVTTFTTFKKQVEAVLMGAVQPSLKVPHLKKFKTLIPTVKEEQTAIATILSDMDNEIQSLEKRLEKARQIKKGMMQELLTGRTRLPFKKD
ncbi:restriction endonuclease subunit S [Vibrio vulnificus]|uniref:restriction endonuclease subunit S n=1 Tax=Vibrio vulnificus TaxID=672 RepID=UPI001CDCC024|nr:restriction endonuclease subunit S [Vibrio vulnificus]MCA4023331.1 restriction endonuclease subunit S [Vibrio vulnificus]